MPSYRLTLPMITWGAAFANTLHLGYPLDNTAAGDEPRAGSDTVQAPSGVEDAWTVGTDYILSGMMRYIPASDTAAPLATGWDGATGFRAFLAWARDKNVLRFCPDATAPGTYIACYLVDPMTGQGSPEPDGTRNVQFKFRNATTPFDGY